MAESDRLRDLLKSFAANRAKEHEIPELLDLLKGSGEPSDEFMDELRAIAKNDAATLTNWEKIWDHVTSKTYQPAKVYKMRWWWAAASVLLVCVASYFIFFNQPASKPVATVDQRVDVEAPKETRAVITLANGRVIPIDSLTRIDQATVQIVKTEDGITYSTLRKGQGDEIYNTLTNPRGSKVVSLTLSDGTKVWLNSESSLRYPVAFTGTTRKVEITGEAYFEVAKDAKKKFFVDAGEVTTEVLGTHFNVNAYEDEGNIAITLLEGSVKVFNNQGDITIKPGQQARVRSNIKPQASNSVDLEKIIAWKNNSFLFSGDNIQTIMRQIARWYDVDVEYKGPITDRHFTGVISRNNKVSEVLKMLQATEKIKFDIVGRKITVSRE